MEVDNHKIDEMKQMNSDDLIYVIEELSESGQYKNFELDDMCDGLHYLLTKSSASIPLKGNYLSEAIVGSEIFAGEDVTDCISYVDSDTVNEILNSLEELDIDAVVNGFEPEEFANHSIYPNMWLKKDKTELQDDFHKYFDGLKDFYSYLAGKASGLIACIY